jgi:hypothetical protein
MQRACSAPATGPVECLGPTQRCEDCGARLDQRPQGWDWSWARVQFLRSLHGDNCHLCSLPMLFGSLTSACNATVDHLLPRAQRGCDCVSNLRLAHRLCNEFRGNSLEFVVSYCVVLRILALLTISLPRRDPVRQQARRAVRTGSALAHLRVMRERSTRAYHLRTLAVVAS